MNSPFDPMEAARKSAALAAERKKLEEEVALRARVKGQRFDWDAEFRRLRRVSPAKEAEPFSALNKAHPWRTLIGAMRRAHASAVFNKQHGYSTWGEMMQRHMLGLRAELLAIATRIDEDHPDDAALLRRLMDSDRAPVLTLEELDYECGKMDVNTATPDLLPKLLDAPYVPPARLLGRRDRAAESAAESAK